MREHWLVPIDDCYELVGLIRTRWRGFGGGEEVWDAIARFFDDLPRAERTRDGDRYQAEPTPGTTRPSHAPGRQPGQLARQLRAACPGTCPTGAPTAAPLDGLEPGRADPIDPRMPNLPPP